MEDQTIIDERHGAVAPIITNRPRYKNGVVVTNNAGERECRSAICGIKRDFLQYVLSRTLPG